MCNKRHPEYLSEFVHVVKNKVLATLKVVNHEELVLIRNKLDLLLKQIGEDCICSDHFFIKLHDHIDWFEEVKEDMGLDTVG